MSAPTKVQTFGNHARFVPGFHFVTGSLTLVILLWGLYRFALSRTMSAFVLVLVGLVLLGQFIYLRAFPLAVQDRLICLEERLRLARLLPPELRSRADSLTPDQLIALRFASDAELPALTEKVLDQNIRARKDIKSLVVDWRPDHMRA